MGYQKIVTNTVDVIEGKEIYWGFRKDYGGLSHVLNLAVDGVVIISQDWTARHGVVEGEDNMFVYLNRFINSANKRLQDMFGNPEPDDDFSVSRKFLEANLVLVNGRFQLR